MAAEEPLLSDLVDAVLEGRPVDWNAAESTISESQRALLAHLRVVAGIASFHAGSSAAADVRTSPSATAATVDALPDGATWGSLQVLERVSRGAFGDVYRARDSRLDREVALKLIRRVESRLDPVASHVIDEGRLLARVRHPNVVTVYGADRIDGRVGLWMELVRGRTLEAVLRDQGSFGEEEATLIGLDLCRALSAVHSANLIHRDVKAQNVMRESGGRVVLMDFGTGLDDRSDGPAELAGTPLYLAPEVLSGAPATVQSDVYSLGVLMFHLVTGTYPVNGRTIAELRDAHRQRRRVWLRDARPDLSDAFVQPVERALATDPAERYASTGEFEGALTRAQSTTNSSDAPEAMPAALAATRRRPSKAVWATVAVGALTIATIGAWVLDFGGWRSRLRLAPPAAPSSAGPAFRKLLLPHPSFESLNGLMGRPSRDGRYMPYVDEQGDVQVFEIGPSRSRRLTDTGTSKEAGRSSLMSPNGDRVAYGWSWPDGAIELRLINTDGSGLQTLIPRSKVYETVPVDWSRDGDTILCWLLQKDGTVDLVLVPTAGGAPQFLQTLRSGAPVQSSLSPDGRFVVYDLCAGRQPQRDLFIVGTDGSSPHVLLDGPVSDCFPLWTPDGSHVFFARGASELGEPTGGWIVPVVNGVASGDLSLVVKELGPNFMALTDSGALYRQVWNAGLSEIYIVSFDPTGAVPPGPPVRISPADVGNHVGPSWSPDDRSIAYFAVSDAAARPGGRPERTLMIQDWPSGTARSLRPSLAVLNGFSPRWAPNSQSVIISGWDTIREGPPSYYRVDVRTSETTPVLVGRGGLSQLSADGRALLYVDSRRGIVAHEIETGKETIVVAKGARSAIYKFGVSPDGLWVAFLSQPGDEDQGLALELQPRGGPARPLLTATSPATLEFQAWMPDSRSLLISRSTVGANKPDRLWRIAVTGGEPQDLHFAVSRAVNQVSLSRDGSRLAYTERNFFLELWVTENVLSPEGARKEPEVTRR